MVPITFVYLLLCSLSSPGNAFLQWTSFRFYTGHLKSTNDCNLFLHSRYNVGRCILYYNGQSPLVFFVDKNRKISLSTCLYSASKTDVKRQVITEFHGITKMSPVAWSYYRNLSRATKGWIELVPHFDVLMGPGGNKGDILVEPPARMFDIGILLSASEVQDVVYRYPDNYGAFLDKFMLNFGVGANRAIQLNGWHLFNTPGIFFWTGLEMFSAIVIHTSPDSSGYLTAGQVISKIPEERQKWVILDLAGKVNSARKGVGNRWALFFMAGFRWWI